MPDGRSVILVTIDSLRADHCHFMGHERPLTPTLDAIAEDGLVYTNAIAPGPATGRSVPATMTGDPHIETAGDRDGRSWRDQVRHHLGARDPLAERFARRGYRTAAFTTNPWTSRHYGYDAGFDRFEDFLDRTTDGGISTRRRGTSAVDRLLGHVRDWWSATDVFLPWEAFADEVMAWLRADGTPYFLWVFLIDVHMPYHPPRPYRSRSAVATAPAHLWLLGGGDPRLGWLFRSTLLDAYEDSVRYADAFLGRLLDAVGNDPLVVVHGDHGEEFGEHGHYGHGSNLCEEVIHVPLVVANGPTGRIDAPVSLTELPRLLTGLARGEVPDVTSPWVFTGNPSNLAVRGADWKYVSRDDGESLVRVGDGIERALDDDQLRAIGRDLVEDWREALAEKRRLRAAVSTLAARAEL